MGSQDEERGSLSGCRAKLKRARRHLDELSAAMKTWGNPHPYKLDKSFDEEAREYVLKISTLRSAPVEEWGTAIGDVLHNLHSTLDALVCVMIKRQDPNHDCRRRGFPILDDSKAWDRRKKNGELDPRSGLGQLAEVDEWTQLTLRSLQPFNLAEPDRRDHALWLLRELSNEDKHRAIHVSSFFLYEPMIEFDPPGSGEMTWARPPGPVNDGDEVLRFRTRPLTPTSLRIEGTKFKWDVPRANRNIRLGADVVFDDGPPADGAKVDVVLDWLLRYVTCIVDLFDYRYFGGDRPEGTESMMVRASSSATVVEGKPESDGGN